MSQFFQGVTAGSLPPSVPTTFIGNTGPGSTPVANIENVIGGSGISVDATGNTLTLTLTEISPTYTDVTFAMSPYTVTATDYFISVNATGGPVTINLPDSPTANRQFIIKDRLGQSQVNNITVKSLTGASTIDGQASYTFSDNYESIECLFHGTNYESF